MRWPFLSGGCYVENLKVLGALRWREVVDIGVRVADALAAAGDSNSPLVKELYILRRLDASGCRVEVVPAGNLETVNVACTSAG